MSHAVHSGAALPDDWCAAVRIRRESLPPGDAGIYRTLDVMRSLVRTASGHPLVRYYAEEAVTGVHPRDYLGQVLAIRDWIASHVEYRRDPIRDEWLQTPWYVLRCQVARGKVPQLDCDDLTMLSTSMLGSIGFRASFKVVSTRADRRYNHVYGLVDLGREWAALDMTRAWSGSPTPAPETRTKIIPALGQLRLAA